MYILVVHIGCLHKQTSLTVDYCHHLLASSLFHVEIIYEVCVCLSIENKAKFAKLDLL
jgi:hypothetical protein